ncbi:hypothetical protein [Pseudomonas atacamensis]|uniref:hypothetical protein n=1 Tax=Pseudomonas atacamensis TaxID=2565368 RepID=UPI0028B8D380|nr:hypothetical protein [Pseudomonas atacamensis]MDT6920795.1 hypothetical protein [Pseudomonas atacamensis]
MRQYKYLLDDDWLLNPYSGGRAWFTLLPPKAPEPVYIEKDEWPAPKPREDRVFAKSCTPDNWCRANAGTAEEPASNFGKIMVAGAMLMPSASTAIATAIGADLALGRLAGGGILQQRLSWAIRGAGGPASVLCWECCRAKWPTARFTRLRTKKIAPPELPLSRTGSLPQGHRFRPIDWRGR